MKKTKKDKLLKEKHPTSMDEVPRIDKYDEQTPEKGLLCEDNIPQELKEKNQWVCWKWEKNGKKWTKPPCNTRNVKIDHQQSNISYEQVATAYKNNTNIAGIGFSIRKNDKFCGIDIDGCIDENGKIKKYAKKIIKKLKSYTEISPSGTGIRIFGLGSPPTLGGSNKHKVEIYNSARYLTVTGIIASDVGLIKKAYPLKNIHDEASELSKKYANKETTSLNVSKKRQSAEGHTVANFDDLDELMGSLAIDYETKARTNLASRSQFANMTHNGVKVNWKEPTIDEVVEQLRKDDLEAIKALKCIPPECKYKEWRNTGACIKYKFGEENGFQIFDCWSSHSQSEKHGPGCTTYSWWSSLKSNGTGYLFTLAEKYGYIKS